MICSHLSRSVTSRTRCSVCLFLSLLVWLLLILLLCTAFSCNCFGVCFLCCIFYFAHLQLSLSLSLYTQIFSHCAYFVHFFFFVFFFYSFLMHTRRIGCFSFCLSGLSFALLLLLLLCAFSLLFFLIYFALSLRSFVRSAALNFNLPNEHKTCVCVCRNATGNGSRRGGGDCYQIGCCTLLHFSSAAISNWLGIGLVSS